MRGAHKAGAHAGLPARARLRIHAVAAVLMMAGYLLVPVLIPADPNATDLAHAYCPPGTQGFWCGSDSVGRDVLLRTLYGGTESVLTSCVVVCLSLVLGTVTGLTAGLMGGAVDTAIDKVVTMFQAFPQMVLAIALAAILGPGTAPMVVALSAVTWTGFCRLARNLAHGGMQADYVRAARVCGASRRALAAKYLLPNMASPLITMAALTVGDVVLTMAGLSFLGLGPARPTNEWGAIMSEQRSALLFAPWCVLVPAAALFVTVTVFNLLGDALRDVLDTRGGEMRR